MTGKTPHQGEPESKPELKPQPHTQEKAKPAAQADVPAPPAFTGKGKAWSDLSEGEKAEVRAAYPGWDDGHCAKHLWASKDGTWTAEGLATGPGSAKKS